MKTLYIRDKNNLTHVYYLSFNTSIREKIKVDDVCIIYITKFHNHRYDIRCFFYDTEYIYCRDCIKTLNELYDVIQNLLQKNLYGAVQK